MGEEGSALARRVFAWLGQAGPVQRLDLGESNTVWFAGDLVVRMSASPGASNLRVEAQVRCALPDSVGYPPVVARGIEDGHEWMATRRLSGENLAVVWAELDHSSRSVRSVAFRRSRKLAVGAAY